MIPTRSKEKTRNFLEIGELPDASQKEIRLALVGQDCANRGEGFGQLTDWIATPEWRCLSRR